jgi:hypothetical protein
VHFPILALLTSALGRFGGFLGLGMDLSQRKISENVANQAGFNVGFQNLW